MLHNNKTVIDTEFVLNPKFSGNELKLILIVSGLSKAGYGCFAGNKYIAKCMGMEPKSVSVIISRLVEMGVFVRDIIKNPKTEEITHRFLRINERFEQGLPTFVFEDNEDDMGVSLHGRIPTPLKTEGIMYYNTLNRDNTTSNNTLSNTNTPVPDLNDLHRPELENTLEASKHLAPNMVSAFLKKFPNYPFFKEVDYKAAFQIAKYIAKEEGIEKSKMLDIAPCQIILEKWSKYLNFISEHKFLCTRSLTQLSAESQWQNVMQEITASKKSKPKISDYEKNRQEQLEKYRNKTTVPQ